MLGMIAFLVIIFGVGWGYYWIKVRVKRNVVMKGQYERQRALTHTKTSYLIHSDVPTIQTALAQRITVDDSLGANFVGGNISVLEQTPDKVSYRHSAHILTGGKGDQFDTSITFLPQEPGLTKAVVSIDRWREKDGITRRRGIDAMTQFTDLLGSTFRDIDPNLSVQVR